MLKILICFLIIFTIFPVTAQLQEINLPPGFSITYFSRAVPGARSMVRGDDGTIFIGTRQDKVYALVDSDNDYSADKVITLLSGLKSPNGVAFKNGSLYVAEINRILRYDEIESKLNDPPEPIVIRDDYPTDAHHGWKYLAIGPDDYLYVPVGAPCNVCDSQDPLYASITRLSLDGTTREIYASGVRNSVGFDWHPTTGELWFTENGRDRMGDDIPPDELNHAPLKGGHYGFPYIHGNDIKDPTFGNELEPDQYLTPAIYLGPHVAALGMKFYTGSQFPAEYVNQIFIAEHGSWNRTDPIGYRISLVKMIGNKALSYEVFADGWLQNGKSWGRPVDILIMPDGSLLVSDDSGGAVYRIAYTPVAQPMKGDIDGNGLVDIVDALKVVQYYVGLITNLDPEVGDVNNDGSINVTDALMIAQFYVGLITEF